MKLDLTKMLEKIERGRWSLDDVDWQAPGADTIRPEQFDKLKAFMTDLVWIEHVGARGFRALSVQAKDPELRAIYRHFEEEEKRHARAELELMHRWGMVSTGDLPVANVNVRLVIAWLDRYAERADFALLTSVIAMLECALDGALVKFLLDEVEDPICHEVFGHINRDEARHLAIDFHVMERVGEEVSSDHVEILQFVKTLADPRIVSGFLTYMPLLSRMRDNLVEMGLDEARLYDSINRFDEVGSRSEATSRSLPFRAVRDHGRMVVDRGHPYHLVADSLVALTGQIPERALGPLPAWTDSLVV